MKPGRFPDPAIEAAFVEQERSAAAARLRLVLLTGGAILTAFLFIIPLLSGAGDYFERWSFVTLAFYLFLAGACGLTFTHQYIKRPALDLIICLLLAGLLVALYLLGKADPAYVDRDVRWHLLHSLLLSSFHVSLLIIVSSLLFVAAPRLFVVWALLVLIGYVAFLQALGLSVPLIVNFVLNFGFFAAFAVHSNREKDRRMREVFAAKLDLEAERAKSEDLLHNVLPGEVAERIKAGEIIADAFGNLTVVFIDIVNFSGLARRLAPAHLIEVLNDFFSHCDRCAESHGVEKVKTIGDAYLAVAGGMASRQVDSIQALAFATDVVAGIGAVETRCGIPVAVRIGLHVGPAIGGVIGSSRLAYDYWGDTLNLASRIEGAAEPGAIAVSEAVFFRTRDAFSFDPPRAVVLKGAGEMLIFSLLPPPPGEQDNSTHERTRSPAREGDSR